MVEASSSSAATGSVAFLLHPSVVPVIDVFRSLSSLEDQYDLALLDGPERGLAAVTQPDAAKAIVSDALLLAFALTRQRGRPFCHQPVGSRHGSMDEYCLLALIGSSRNGVNGVSDVAQEAAALLDIVSLDFMVSLAGEIIRQMDLGTLVRAPEPARIQGLDGLRPVRGSAHRVSAGQGGVQLPRLIPLWGKKAFLPCEILTRTAVQSCLLLSPYGMCSPIPQEYGMTLVELLRRRSQKWGHFWDRIRCPTPERAHRSERTRRAASAKTGATFPHDAPA